MGIAPHHVFCFQCGAACPPHARFCGTCGDALSAQNTGTQQKYALPRQNRPVSPIQKAQSVPALPLSQPPIIPTEQTVKQLPSTVPSPLTRKLPTVEAGHPSVGAEH